jgi:putative ABC transport system permease protein
MRWFYKLPLRLQSLFRTDRVEQELTEELRFHLEQLMEEKVARGMTAEEARYAALRELGGVEQIKEECRDMRRVDYVENFFQDIRYGLRVLAKNPRFTAVAVLTLALGIGATTLVFSVIYNGLLNPFPYKHAGRLATFYIHGLQNPGQGDRLGLLPPEFFDFREQNHVFEDMLGVTNREVVYTNSEETLQLNAALVTPNAFQFLGVKPLLGRPITPEDAKLDAPPVFAMNYYLWQKYFNGDPKIVGASFVLGGVPRTLVAIMPPRFQLHNNSDLWLPTTPSRSDTGRSANAAEPTYLWWSIGRLKPGVSLQAAAADLDVIAQRVSKSYPGFYPKQFTVMTKPLIDAFVGNFKGMLYALIGAAAMLLLITCSNVANLLLARATAREKEIAIRAAIGASRSRLVRQLLVESFVLAAAGAALGCLLAYSGLKGVVTVIPHGTLPDEAVMVLNQPVLLFAVAVTMLTTLLCGLAPALHAVRGELHMRLKDTGRGASGAFRHGRLRGGLVIVEVALSMVLLVGTGLMVRTSLALAHVDLGFNPANILFAQLSFPRGRYDTTPQKKVFFQQVLERVKGLPGVTAATVSFGLPLYDGASSEVDVPGKAHAETWNAMLQPCTAGYFQTLGRHLVRGRQLLETDVDSARQVAVINQALARNYFDNQDPVGQKIKFKVLDHIPDAPHNAYFEIIGVVSDARNRGLQESAMPEAYIPYTILPLGRNILVKTAASPLSMLKSVSQAIWAVDRGVALADAGSLESYLHRFSYEQPEFGLLTLGTFAGLGLALVAIGTFSVMAYSVSLRTREIGIRMALGAQQNSILRMVLGKGLRWIAAGILMGLLTSFGLTRFLASQTWGVSATDPMTLGAVAGVVAAVGLGACLLPSRRATKVDPMVALRYE